MNEEIVITILMIGTYIIIMLLLYKEELMQIIKKIFKKRK